MTARHLARDTATFTRLRFKRNAMSRGTSPCEEAVSGNPSAHCFTIAPEIRLEPYLMDTGYGCLGSMRGDGS